MPNKNNYIKFHFFHLPLVVLSVLVVGALTYTVFTQDENAAVLGSKVKSTNIKQPASSNKSSVTGKTSKIKEAVTPEAKIHKNTMTEVVTNLEKVADTEDIVGNTDVSEEVSAVAENTEETASDSVEAIDEIESRPSWKVALLGPDYKNLGQLRSNLSQNTNQIRKLTKSMEGATIQNQEQIQAQIESLTQERQRIYEIVSTNESRFSILGWVSKLISGYTPIDTVDDGDASTEPSTGLETLPDTSLETMPDTSLETVPDTTL